MPRYVIHVGPFKTGSSYMQFGFKRYRDQLARHGIYCDTALSGGPLWNRDIPKTNAEHGTDLAASEADRHEVILISNERLSSSNALRNIHGIVGDNPVDVVFYIRRWSELIPSAWQENVRSGYAVTLPEYILQFLQEPRKARLTYSEATIEHCASIFGMKNIKRNCSPHPSNRLHG